MLNKHYSIVPRVMQGPSYNRGRLILQQSIQHLQGKSMEVFHAKLSCTALITDLQLSYSPKLELFQ